MKRQSVIKAFFLLAGFAIFIYLFQQLGVTNVLGRMYQMGWGFFIILFFPVLIQQVLFVYGWKFTFPGPSSRFQDLFQVHLLGEAFNYITPGGQMGGEPLKALSLKKEHGGVQALGSVITAKTGKTMAMAFFILAGILLAIHNLTLAPRIQQALIASIGALILLSLLFLFLQHKGLFGPLMRFIEKKFFFIPESFKEKIAHFDDLDAKLKEFYSDQKGKFFISLLFFTVAWTVGFLEIYLILHLLGVKATLSTALIIEALSLIINATLFFVPAGIGTQEGGKVFIFKLLSIDPALGLALGLVRRMRELTWVALGLIVFAYWPAHGREPVIRLEVPATAE